MGNEWLLVDGSLQPFLEFKAPVTANHYVLMGLLPVQCRRYRDDEFAIYVVLNGPDGSQTDDKLATKLKKGSLIQGWYQLSEG